MLRTTQNKIYRQGIATPNELADGFPSKPEDTIQISGIAFWGVWNRAYFTTTQQQMIKDFVDRRGGGLLFLGGRGLGGWWLQCRALCGVAAGNLPYRKNTFQRTFVAAGIDRRRQEKFDLAASRMIRTKVRSTGKCCRIWRIIRIRERLNRARWFWRAWTRAETDAAAVTENLRTRKTAVFATGGELALADAAASGGHECKRCSGGIAALVVSATPSRVVASTPNASLEDDGRIQLRAEVRDTNYLPARRRRCGRRT